MDKTYLELMEVWLQEQDLRIKECQHVINRNKEEIKLLNELNTLNEKQIVLIQKQINDGNETVKQERIKMQNNS